MVSHPETGLDSPIGSDRELGRDTDLKKSLVLSKHYRSEVFCTCTVKLGHDYITF